tara:strand:- start:4307 stop:4879 length:573 start_codon:yes stop_codon:yes gene_type:complete
MDMDVMFGHPFIEGLINLKLQQIPEEFSCVLWNLLGLKNRYVNALEIGVAGGYSAIALSRLLKLDSITLIDDGKHDQFRHVKNILKNVDYDLFVGDSTSKEALEFIESKQTLFDLIHIDGNHLYEFVIQDFKNYSQFLSKDGLIVLHDSRHIKGPRDVVIEIYEMKHPEFKIVCNIGNRFGSAIVARNRV